MEELRECKNHGETKFIYRASEDRWRCKKCAVDAVQRRREKLKILAIVYKGGKCELCGYDKYVGAL